MRFGCAVLGIVLTVSEVASAQSNALDTLRQRDASIRGILGPENRVLNRVQEGKLKQVLSATFDYDGHARLALGKYWDQMNSQDRNEAIALVTVLLERSSLEKVRQLPQTIEYVSETPRAGGVVSVLTRVSRGSDSWEVAYQFQHTAQQWKIFDVLVDGASTLDSNRAAFYKEIRETGVAGLLRKLRAKAAQERAP